MPATKLSGPPARDLLDRTIAADHELELYRDIFEHAYGRRRYKRAYAHYAEHGTIGRAMIEHCNGIISKHQLR